MRRWTNPRHTALLDEINQVLSALYPSLCVVQVKPRIVIRGWFPVRLERTTLDRFCIEIEFPNDYPKSVPTVREIGNRIPHDIDHHIIGEGILCLFVPDERWKYWGEGKDVRAFLGEIVNDFFLGQLYFERHGSFPFGERRHGVDGIYDYYAEELGTNEPAVIERCIKYLSRKKAKGHWKCYCGSGKKLRHCHRDKMSELRTKVPSMIAKVTLLRLQLAAMSAREEALKHQSIALRYRWQLALSSFRSGSR